MRYFLLTFVAFLLATGCGFSEQKEITLPLPDPITSAPKLPSIRVTIYAPDGWDQMTFHDKPTITEWKDQLFVAWTAAKRSEKSRPTHGFISYSSDKGHTWSKPEETAKNGNRAYVQYMRKKFPIPPQAQLIVCVRPVGFHEIDGDLYFFQKAWVQYEKPDGRVESFSSGRLFKTSNGKQWVEISPTELDKKVDETIRRHWMAHRFVKLDNGNLLAPTISNQMRAPFTKDLDGLTGWEGTHIPMEQKIVDPFAWQGPDGIVHFVAGRLSRTWHAYSKDNGKTWTPLMRQSQFTDNNGGLIFGKLPDGSIFYVGTPLEYSQRCPLLFARSKDGWNFGQLCQIRWEPFYRKYPWPYKGYRPGYEFPDAIYANDRLYVVYALCRDEIELSIVDVRNMLD